MGSKRGEHSWTRAPPQLVTIMNSTLPHAPALNLLEAMMRWHPRHGAPVPVNASHKTLPFPREGQVFEYYTGAWRTIEGSNRVGNNWELSTP